MKTFKKTLFSMVCFMCILSILSAIIIYPYSISESDYQDKYLRDQLSGQLDFLILGASHAAIGFDPRIIDEKLSCNSYNLSNMAMTLHGRKFLLEKELERNPVNTVVLELSYDTLVRSLSDEMGRGDQLTMRRLGSLAERAEFLFKHVPVNDWLNIYSRNLNRGVSYWCDYFSNKEVELIDYSKKGFTANATNNCTLSPEASISDYNKESVSIDYLEKNIEQFGELIKFCKAKNLNVIVAVVPISDATIWCKDGWDAFYQWATVFCEEYGCAFYDFNLLKNRYDIFSDSESFGDGTHMGAKGGEVFSAVFCDILLKTRNGENISSYFFDSYQEMKQHSPYAAYLP